MALDSLNDLTEEDRPFEEVYDEAVQRVVMARRHEAVAKTTAKLAKEELGLAYDALSRLRPGRPLEDDDDTEGKPQQLPMSRTGGRER